MEIKKPFNLQKWIDDNRHLLKPPVGNKNLYIESGDYIVMIVAGPNARKDYHYNETEELFYQIEGDIVVKTQQNGKLVEVPIKAGEMFLLPAKIPHSPVRSEGSIGLVIERKRKHRALTKWDFVSLCKGEAAGEGDNPILAQNPFFPLAEEDEIDFSEQVEVSVIKPPS